ncbi:MAG: hypothetical protein FJZ92_08225 [Chloroflexi bacterium]|nr:hypothetical protein [Chloroflexota bacterium]
MSRYLIVTHQTALTSELHEKVRELVAADPQAEFTILVPELPSSNFSWEGESVDVAEQRAEAAQSLLRETMRANVTRAVVGVSDPLQAIRNELEQHPGYETLVVCTLPPGISRWLRLDLVHQAGRKFGLPTVHVVAHAPLPTPP